MKSERSRTITVAATPCLVCSVLVSTAAVVLKPAQQQNKRLDIQQNILKVAGIYDESKSVTSQFRRVESRLIDLNTGDSLSAEEMKAEGINPLVYDARKAAKDPHFSIDVEPAGALPQIARRELYAFAYEVRDLSGRLDQVVLPVYGKGLWSTLYGFLSIDADGVTIRGITFYEHGETPGLGGEVDNELWKKKWHGKKLFAEQPQADELPVPDIEVIKGVVLAGPQAELQVDGLSGATITSRGVTSMLRYWLGPDGFGPYLKQVRENNSGDQTEGGANG